MDNTITPLVSIITVNYNTTEITCDLLESIKQLSYCNTEVIVVDNASDETPTFRLKEVLSSVVVIRSDKNLGFAGGNNLGIKAAKGEFLFFVNNDTILTSNIIEGLLEICLSIPDAGMVCPKFHYFFQPGIIEYAGYQQVSPFTGRISSIGRMETDKGQYDQLKVTYYAHGGAMFVPVQVIKKIGLMPENYFLYYEEFDWCEKIKKNGYKIYYQPKSLIYHKESMSTGKASALKTYYLTRNRILFMRRNSTFQKLVFFYTFLIAFTIPKNVIFYLIKLDFTLLNAFIRGLFWNIQNAKLRNT